MESLVFVAQYNTKHNLMLSWMTIKSVSKFQPENKICRYPKLYDLINSERTKKSVDENKRSSWSSWQVWNRYVWSVTYYTQVANAKFNNISEGTYALWLQNSVQIPTNKAKHNLTLPPIWMQKLVGLISILKRGRNPMFQAALRSWQNHITLLPHPVPIYSCWCLKPSSTVF